MYRIVCIERQGDTVFKTEIDTNDLKEARDVYNKEKTKKDAVDVRLWYCTELERFVRENVSQ